MKRSRSGPIPIDLSAELSAESTLTIQPDGRIFAFGITRPLVELLAAIPAADDRARRLLETLPGTACPEDSPHE
jgi:hypothetical protein